MLVCDEINSALQVEVPLMTLCAIEANVALNMLLHTVCENQVRIADPVCIADR